MGFKGLQHFHNRYTCALFPFWFHLPPAVLPLSRNRFVIFIIYGTEQLTALIHVVPMCIQDVQSCYKMYCVWCCRMLWVKMAIEINTNPAKYPRQWFFRWFTATANKYAVLHQVIFIVDRNRIPPPLQHKKEHSLADLISSSLNLKTSWRSGGGILATSHRKSVKVRWRNGPRAEVGSFERFSNLSSLRCWPLASLSSHLRLLFRRRGTRSAVRCPSAEPIGQQPALQKVLRCHWVPVKLASRLLLHGVLDGPPLPRAGAQDQQVAEVDVSRYHLQTAARGSIYERFVLQGEGGTCGVIRVHRGTVTRPISEVQRCSHFIFSG